ncbi:MAG: hypothetical protein R3Y39_05585 [Rikenellaceae bacterium]
MKRCSFLVFLLLIINISFAQKFSPQPLYTDPTFQGVADPEVIWNEEEQEWWVYYTCRRAVCEGAPLPALAIGVASSKDWIEWNFRGYIKVDGVGGTAMGADILWAPGIVRDGDIYHMFLTFKKGDGRGERWGINESLILHLKAPQDDLLHGWQTYGALHASFKAIDATIMKCGDVWNILHRDNLKKERGVNTYRVTTTSLDTPCSEWNYLGASKGDVNDVSVTGYGYQEGQFLFYWKDQYWLLTDHVTGGIPVYKSNDVESWEFCDEILIEDGVDPSQKGWVRHPSVVVIEDRAFIFYFCQPYLSKDKDDTMSTNQRADAERCFLQITELKYEGGKITADRDELVVPPTNLVLNKSHWGFSDENK